MDTVYIVSRIDNPHEDSYIHGVYSTLELAREKRTELYNENVRSVAILEYIIDSDELPKFG